MSLLARISGKQKWKEEARRQKEKGEKYRGERDQWKRAATKVREFASRRYIRGCGIEIGGLHRPLPVFEGAAVKYVDRMTTAEIRNAYPELKGLDQVTVDIVDDGETLGAIGAESQDFVIANHMLEHARDPIRTVQNFLRVLKPGGVIFVAIPDKRFTFDRNRSVTPFEHIRRDYLEGPAWSEREHFEDWVAKEGDPLTAGQIRERADAAIAKGANIHFHVWTQAAMVEMFARMAAEFGFPMETEAALRNGHEVVVVIRKTPIPDEAPAGSADFKNSV
jgi:SAM-dependent methyltransferase